MAANPSSRKRRFFWIGALLGFGLLLARFFFFQGVITPIRIAGGSMAETLVGDHFALVCDDCRYLFRCGLEGISSEDLIVCPNCGYPRNLASADKLLRGQRVLIDRFSTFVTSPQRWQIAAIKNPSTPGGLAVKRIVGLPGERVAIRDGDLFINDQIVTKPLTEQGALRLSVYDDRFRPTLTKNLPPRWAAGNQHDDWRADSQGYLFAAPTSKEALSEEAWRWLTYHHWRCFASPFPRTNPASLLDNDPYSPNESRELHDVSDITLSFRAQLASTTRLAVLFDTGRDRFLFKLTADQKKWTCEQNGKPLWETNSTRSIANHVSTLEFSLCDHSAALRVDGDDIQCASFTPSVPTKENAEKVRSSCAIGATGGEVRVTDLQIFRDVYYLPLFGRGDHWTLPEPLGPSEYFVLGDNPAISVDSRDPSFGVVPREAIIGEVLNAPSP